MKLIYAAMFALFPLSAPAQTPDALLLSALCSDDYYEDTGQCRAGEVLNILDLLEKYNAVVNRDANHDELVGVLPSDIPEDMRVGSIDSPN